MWEKYLRFWLAAFMCDDMNCTKSERVKTRILEESRCTLCPAFEEVLEDGWTLSRKGKMLLHHLVGSQLNTREIEHLHMTFSFMFLGTQVWDLCQSDYRPK